MPLCPQCSAEVSSSDRKCPSCGAELHLTSDPTAVQDADHTPTRLKKTKAEERVHTTASGSGARFVAGHVLAGRYRIIGLIGRGGMGEVYKAEDLELDQTVALKFLPVELSKEEELLKRFRSEVRTARQVSHPNVCRVFDIGETEGLYYITMEYIEGDDLSMLLQRIGRLPSDKAVEISREIATGLNAIHSAGILHRDLKPSNIIIDQRGRARITDFGIAGIEAEVQGEESRVGTPAYMSPEQITGKEVTKRSDIYSLGLLLYEIFTGKQAFEGSSVQELREKHTKETPTNPSELVTGIDPVVEDLIERCLKKDPKERPDSALKVAMMLPGGNPLQVALEAGETPTPEMVAAAPRKGVLSRGTGLAFAFTFFILFLVHALVIASYQEVLLEPVTKSEDVLINRANEIISAFGFTESPIGVTYGFDVDENVHRYAKDHPSGPEFWQRFRNGQPAIFRFDYRQSPDHMVPMDEDGPVTAQDPPMLVPGMIRLELDVTGRLLSFTAVPLREEINPDRRSKADWPMAFSLAGLDIEKFEPYPVSQNPVYFADELFGWKGSLADNPDIPIRVEGTAANGRITGFHVQAPWSTSMLPSVTTEERRGVFASDAFTISLILIMIIVLTAASLIAAHNVRNGRGDVRGAIKLAIAAAIVTFVTYILALQLTGDVAQDLIRLAAIFAAVPFIPLLIFLLYLAIEPVVRKRLPKLLVSWNRLLAGKFTDPLIGKEFLIGLTLGMISPWLTEGVKYAAYLLRGTYFEPFEWSVVRRASGLNSSDLILSWGLAEALFFLLYAFFFLFLYLVINLFFRNKFVSGSLTVLILTLPVTIGPTIEGDFLILLDRIIYPSLMLFAMLRFGLVAAWAFMLATPAIDIFSFDTDRFYSTLTYFVVVKQALLAAAAFFIATSGQPWIKKDLLG